MDSGLIKVKVVKLKNRKFQYIGVREDGSEVVLRKGATRLYQYAFYYNVPVSSGTTGLASHFAYGKAPGNFYIHNERVHVWETFEVQWTKGVLSC